jgi:hypothetical protein
MRRSTHERVISTVGAVLVIACGGLIAARYFHDGLLGFTLVLLFGLGVALMAGSRSFTGDEHVFTVQERVRALEEKIASLTSGASGR